MLSKLMRYDIHLWWIFSYILILMYILTYLYSVNYYYNQKRKSWLTLPANVGNSGKQEPIQTSIEWRFNFKFANFRIPNHFILIHLVACKVRGLRGSSLSRLFYRRLFYMPYRGRQNWNYSFFRLTRRAIKLGLHFQFY